MVVFLATNLSEDVPHTLTVQNIGSPGGANNVIDVDRLIVNSSRSFDVVYNGTNTTTSTSTSAETGSSSGANAGVIAGSVVGAVVGLGLLAFAVWFFFTRRKRLGRGGKPEEIVDLTSDIRSYAHGGSNGGQGAISSNESYITAFPPPPASTATSYPQTPAGFGPQSGSSGPESSAYNPSTTAVDSSVSKDERLMAAAAGHATVSPVISTMSPPSNTSTRPPLRKIETSGASLSSQTVKQSVRETDAGPVRHESEEGHGESEALPPAYENAVGHQRREDANRLPGPSP